MFIDEDGIFWKELVGQKLATELQCGEDDTLTLIKAGDVVETAAGCTRRAGLPLPLLDPGSALRLAAPGDSPTVLGVRGEIREKALL